MQSVERATRYLWRGPTGPFQLNLDEGVFVPTSTSRELAEGVVVNPGETVIDVGFGSGVLSFVAARMGAGKVYGTEVNAPSVDCARRNASRLGLSNRVDFRLGSLFEPLKNLVADVVIGDVSGVPDSLAAVSGWFPGGFSGGPTGAELPVAMLEGAAAHLKPGGRMYLPTGSIQDEGAVLRAARHAFGNMAKIRERAFPMPSLIAESAVVKRLSESGAAEFIRRGSRILWTLRVWECRSPAA